MAVIVHVSSSSFRVDARIVLSVQKYINAELWNANVTISHEAYDVRTSDYSQNLILGYQHFEWSSEQSVPTISIGDSRPAASS